MILETVGAVCIIIGLFTRFFAAAMPSSWALPGWRRILKAGFFVNNGVRIRAVARYRDVAIVIGGGGTYWSDRLIGKEL